MKKIILVLIFVLCNLTGCSSASEPMAFLVSDNYKEYSSNDKFIIDTYRKVLTETLTLEEWQRYFSEFGYTLMETEKESEFGKYIAYEMYGPHDVVAEDTGLMGFSFYEIDDTIMPNSKYVEFYALPLDDEKVEAYTIDMELAKIRNELGYNLRDANSSSAKGIWKKGTYEEHSISRSVSLLATENTGDYKEYDYALIRNSSLGTELYSDMEINGEFISTQIQDILDLDLKEKTVSKYMSKYNSEPQVLSLGEDVSYIWGNSYENVNATAGIPVNYWELKYIKYAYVLRIEGLYQLTSKDPESYIQKLYEDLSKKFNVHLEKEAIVFEDTSFNDAIDSLKLGYSINGHYINLNLDIYLKQDNK